MKVNCEIKGKTQKAGTKPAVRPSSKSKIPLRTGSTKANPVSYLEGVDPWKSLLKGLRASPIHQDL